MGVCSSLSVFISLSVFTRIDPTFNIAHLSKIFVNFNLIMMSKPKYIVILTGLFCSMVAGVLRTFIRFFSVNVLARVEFLL